MTLPIDLVFVRHGQSEINRANRFAEAGDKSKFTKDFRKRPSSSFPLSERGREQARQAGAYLRAEFCEKGIIFRRFVTSEYDRARETAGLLDLPSASWYTDPYLAERGWGKLEVLPDDERQRHFMAELRRRRTEPFFWTPPHGESFKLLCLYADRVLDTFHRAKSKEPMIVVCHGEVMRAIDMRIKRMSQEQFRKLIFSKDRKDIIFNGQIVHYTRRNPFDATRPPLSYMGWVRWIRPTETPVTTSDWQEIVRPRYSNGELIESVHEHQRWLDKKCK